MTEEEDELTIAMFGKAEAVALYNELRTLRAHEQKADPNLIMTRVNKIISRFNFIINGPSEEEEDEINNGNQP